MTHSAALPSPPRRFQIETRDRDAAVDRLQAMWSAPRVEIQRPLGTFEWRMRGVDLGPILFTLDTSDASPCFDLSSPTHMMALLTEGRSRSARGRDTADFAPGAGMTMVSPGQRTSFEVDGPLRTVNARFAPGYLASQLEALTGETARDPLVFSLSVPTGQGPGAFIAQLYRFIATTYADGSAPDSPAVAAGLVDSLARALLVGTPHSHAHLLERPAPPSSRTVVRRVEEYLDEHADQPVTLADLAAVAGAGVRSVEAAFRRHRDATPTAFLRARRLGRARQMLQADLGVPISGVAHACGFAQPVAFAAAYVKAHGERPEDTRRRALLAGGLPPRPDSSRPGAPLEERLSLLTAREREIGQLVAQGLLSKQIAAQLGISERTVNEHRGRAMAKLGAKSAAELGALLREALRGAG
jgi:DNA-binding CsgD family transcriptional regulator/AraC-like DNA-binding protein